MTDYGDRGTFLGCGTWATFDDGTITLRVYLPDGVSIKQEIILDRSAFEELRNAHDDEDAAHVKTG